ncbi:MAG: hypothetical protein JWR27_1160 [Aeromicrobium sp.]|nr:hypothetical protein [Aeromicrobium sp.]
MRARRPVVHGDSGKWGAAPELALAEAARRQTTLRVVHCAQVPAGAAELFLSETMYRDVMTAGQTILDTTRAFNDGREKPVEVEYVLSDGAPTEVLVEVSRRRGSWSPGSTTSPGTTGCSRLPWQVTSLDTPTAP